MFFFLLKEEGGNRLCKAGEKLLGGGEKQEVKIFVETNKSREK